MDLYQYSSFCEEITLKSGDLISPHKNRTNKMRICTFIVFNKQKLKWDMLQAEYDGEREREKSVKRLTDKMIEKIGRPLGC